MRCRSARRLTARRRARSRCGRPAAAEVDVGIAQQRGRAPSLASDVARLEGWHAAVLASAGAGTRYRYRIDGATIVPDPASRFNPDDVHGPSEVIDPRAFEWTDDDWRGRPWHEAVIYELHVGTFTPEGTFAGVEPSASTISCELGVTAIELMPIADFPGARNWGYDGVLPYAPDASYGTPDDLKALVDAAHARGLMVLLDVVYNHFGPEGNYLHATRRSSSPSAITRPGAPRSISTARAARVVRDFFIHNALYWLEEYHFDGLRFDAVHAIVDDSDPHILTELAQARARGPGTRAHIHLVLENDATRRAGCARCDGRPRATPRSGTTTSTMPRTSLLTGERDGYYADYAGRAAAMLGRCLAEGFAYQGEPSPLSRRASARRAERAPAAHGVRRLPAEPRSGRQPRVRRAARRAR